MGNPRGSQGSFLKVDAQHAPLYHRRMPRPRPRPLPRMPIGPPRPGMGPPPPAPSGGCDRGLRTVSSTDRICKYAHAQGTVQSHSQLYACYPAKCSAHFRSCHAHALQRHQKASVCPEQSLSMTRPKTHHYRADRLPHCCGIASRTYQAGSLCCCSNGIGLHKRWLPDIGPICVHNTACGINPEVSVTGTSHRVSLGRFFVVSIQVVSCASSALRRVSARSGGVCMAMQADT